MINKLELLKEICKHYSYNLTIGDEKIIDDNTNEDGIPYSSVEEGLKDWLETLEESNKCCIDEEVPLLWNDEEIEFIKSLEV